MDMEFGPWWLVTQIRGQRSKFYFVAWDFLIKMKGIKSH